MKLVPQECLSSARTKGTEHQSQVGRQRDTTHLANEAFTMESKSFQEKRKNVGMKKVGWWNHYMAGPGRYLGCCYVKRESARYNGAHKAHSLGSRRPHPQTSSPCRHRGAPCASTWALGASLRDPFVVETGRLATAHCHVMARSKPFVIYPYL